MTTPGYWPVAPVAPGAGIAASDFKLDSIDLYLTSSCNRRCTYCFLPDSYFDSRAQMSLDMVRSIVEWSYGTANEVTLLGGEPALHPSFAQIVRLAAQAAPRVRTVTNGSRRFRTALADQSVRSGLNRVAVSLDAPSAAMVDRLRGTGAFADARSTLEELKQAGIPFDINCTVVASVVDAVPDMLSFAEAVGADRLNMHWFSAVGRGRVHAVDQAVSAEDWRRRVLDVVAAYRPERPDFVVDCELAFSYGLPGEDAQQCAVRDRTNLQFLPSGAVFSCGILVDDESKSGYQWHDNALRIRPGTSELTLTKQACAGCPVRDADGGSLPICIYNRLAR